MQKRFTDVDKWCPDCETQLPLVRFGDDKQSPSGKSCYCKKCARTRKQKYPIAQYRRKSLYGDNEERYQELKLAQHGCCALCDREVKRLCIDHVHGSEPIRIRELLCVKCNAMLGHLKDSVEAFEKVIAYLRKYAVQSSC